MRIAAISDIHGNLAALDAVLADIGRRGVDRIVNLGDILSGPLDPAATADRLIALDLPTIRGNHERQLLTLDRAAMGASDAHAAPLLTDAHRAWLTSLPATMRLAPDILLCHGTPGRNAAQVVEHEGRKLVFCSDPCRWIFQREPQRYARHQSVVGRVLAGEAPANLVALLRRYFGLEYESWGKDVRGGDYDWLDRSASPARKEAP